MSVDIFMLIIIYFIRLFLVYSFEMISDKLILVKCG